MGRHLHSGATLTPADFIPMTPAAHLPHSPSKWPFSEVARRLRRTVRDNIRRGRFILQLRAAGFYAIRAHRTRPSPAVEARKRSARMASHHHPWTMLRRFLMGSLEITRIDSSSSIERKSLPFLPSCGRAIFQPSLVPGPRATRRRVKFPPCRVRSAESPQPRFSSGSNVNAELILYGRHGTRMLPSPSRTAPHAARRRSFFSLPYRFGPCPMAKYELPAVAISAYGTDGRAAELKLAAALNTGATLARIRRIRATPAAAGARTWLKSGPASPDSPLSENVTRCRIVAAGFPARRGVGLGGRIPGAKRLIQSARRCCPALLEHSACDWRRDPDKTPSWATRLTQAF